MFLIINNYNYFYINIFNFNKDDQFKADEEQAIQNLNNKNYLFAKFWKLPDDDIEIRYYLSAPPGSKSGVSSSMVYGKYLGISKLISEEKKQAAVQVLKYLTSPDIQKQLLLSFNHFYSCKRILISYI